MRRINNASRYFQRISQLRRASALESSSCPFRPNVKRQRKRTYSSSRPVFNQHAKDLLQHLKSTGVLGLQDQRPIRIEAKLWDGKTRPEETKDKVSKLIHFQRHGQGYHNLLFYVLRDAGFTVTDIYSDDPTKNPFVRHEIVDAPLTDLGKRQCEERRQTHVLAQSLTPQVVIVSPLHRALQTAQLTFDDSNVPMIAHELCREELGLLTCNKRRPISSTVQEFPNIDFSILQQSPMHTDEDSLWDPNQREPPKDQSQRIYDFLTNFVRERPETEMALVGHSAWFFLMCHTVLTNAHQNKEDSERLQEWFQTAEIRSMILTFKPQGSTTSI